MTHMKHMNDSDGTFSKNILVSDHKCSNCNQVGGVTVQKWESSDGAYEDYKYTCTCGHTWWVDGIDS